MTRTASSTHARIFLCFALALAASSAARAQSRCTSVVYAPGQDAHGLVLFEDNWPANGDLDFNDQAISYSYELALDYGGQVVALDATFNVLSVGASFHNGLYLHLPGVAASTVVGALLVDSLGNSVSVSPVAGESELVFEIARDTRALFARQDSFINTSPAIATQNALRALRLQLTFAAPLALSPAAAPFDLFIARSDNYDWQIHQASYPGTALAMPWLSANKFHTGADGSGGGRWFVNTDGLPFALDIPQLIAWPDEKIDIGLAYGNVAAFGASGGTAHTDWYVGPPANSSEAAARFTSGAASSPPPSPIFVSSSDPFQSCLDVGPLAQAPAVDPASVHNTAQAAGASPNGAVAPGQTYRVAITAASKHATMTYSWTLQIDAGSSVTSFTCPGTATCSDASGDGSGSAIDLTLPAGLATDGSVGIELSATEIDPLGDAATGAALALPVIALPATPSILADALLFPGASALAEVAAVSSGDPLVNQSYSWSAVDALSGDLIPSGGGAGALVSGFNQLSFTAPASGAGPASLAVTATNGAGSATGALSVALVTVPGAPTGVSASGGVAQATVSWSAPASDGGSALTGFVITPYLGSSAGTPVAISGATATSAVVSGLTNGATYTFTVAATNAVGTGPASSASNAVTPADLPPSGLGYASALVCTINTACALSAPTVGGGAVVSYTIAPALPAGLAIDAGSGAIAGTPTALSAATVYTVTASNTGGSTTASVTVTVNDLAPTGLTYTPAAQICFVNQPCTFAAPTSGGGAVVAYSISGLPAGLSFNTGTGAISGAASGVSPLTSYTVTASNSGGSTTASVTITVNAGNLIGTSGAIAGGVYHSCALVNGQVLCWGNNIDGQLGNNSTVDSHLAVAVQGLPAGAQAVSGGNNHTCAVVNGGAWCWGYNGDGELGNNSTANSSLPVQVQGLSSGVSAIFAGYEHSCALVNGAVSCWGLNSNGQLGDNTTNNSLVPVAVSGLNGVQAIAGDHFFSCALANGGVKCWGYNAHGELGNNTTIDSHVPVQVSGLTAGVQALSANDFGACVIAGGGVKCWGYNQWGQVGNGSSGNNVLVPAQVVGLTSGALAISTGFYHSCAVVSGGVKCWGLNTSGQLGNNSVANSSSPVTVVGITVTPQAIASGFAHTCALINGGLQCWGNDLHGQLGNNATANALVPVQAIGMVQGIASLAAGGLFSDAVVNGGVVGWGENNDGQLGNNTTVNSSVPTASQLTAGAQQVVNGASHTCALINGDVDCWGFNNHGQVGNNTAVESNVPVAVTSLSADAGVSALAIGAGADHACAVVNGGAECWGLNGSGQLGNNATADSHVPVKVTAIGNTDGGVQALGVGVAHTCALVNGGVECWGANPDGELGNNSTTASKVPVPVLNLAPGDGGVAAIALGYTHTCALSNGGVQCWGANADGELGNNSTTSSSVPVPVWGLSSGVQAIAAGDQSTCALVNGGLWCWGDDNAGQLGNGALVNSPIPVQVAGFSSGVEMIASGLSHECALVNGGVYCWGDNLGGDLGNNAVGLSSVPSPVFGLTHP